MVKLRILVVVAVVFLVVAPKAQAAEPTPTAFCWARLPVVSWFVDSQRVCSQSPATQTSSPSWWQRLFRSDSVRNASVTMPSSSSEPASIDVTDLVNTISSSSSAFDLSSDHYFAGQGISIRGLTISNTGVLSLTAGSGITVDDSTITNSDPGSSQAIFKNIKVGGQDTITAEANDDNVTFVAGSGISITTDSSSDIVTIGNTVTAGSLNGWNSTTGLVSLATTSNDVVIGGSSSLGKLSLVGDSDEVQLALRAYSSQTANLFELQNNSGTTLASFSSSGALTLPSNGLSVGSQLTVTNGRVGIGSTSPTTTLDINGSVKLASNSGISLFSNNSAGTVTRLISLRGTTKYDRAWISHLDYTGRHVITYGGLDTNNDETVHKRFELKTVADSAGATPNELLTRLAIDYDRDLADIIFGQIDSIGIHNDYGDRIKMVHQMRDSSDTASYPIGQWITELGAGDSTVMTIDPKTITSTMAATLRFFRETNTAAQRRFVIHKGDGTSTESLVVNADTGNIDTNANGEGLTMGDGTNVSSYINMQANRTMVGYDGSNATLQGGTNKGIKFNVNSSSFGAGTVMTIMATGEVGVGTTTPAALFSVGSGSPFQVNSSGAVTAASLTTSGIASISGNLTLNSAASLQTTLNQNLTIGGNTTGNIYLQPLNGVGRVGIGTTSPSTALHVASNGASLALGDGTNVSGYVNVQSNRTMVGYDGSFAVLQGGTSKGVKLNVNASSFGTGTAMTILSNGNIGMGTTNPTLGPLEMASGAYVTSGGTWTNSSDRNKKTNFTEVDPEVVLTKINDLPITSWNYKVEDPSIRHIGPMAQDFYALFGVGQNDTTISTIDPAGIALAGIQGLDKKIGRLALQLQAQGLVVTNIASQATTVSPLVNSSPTPAPTSTTINNLESTGGLVAWGKSLFKENTLFENMVSFLSNTIFKGKVTFEKSPEFSRDTTGVAIIKQGADHVSIGFSEDYPQIPQVNITLTAGQGDGAEQQVVEELIFNQDLRYLVTHTSVHGFTIKLNRPAPTDLNFSWVALHSNQTTIVVGSELSSPAPAASSPVPSSQPSANPSSSPTSSPEDHTPATSPSPEVAGTSSESANLDVQ